MYNNYSLFKNLKKEEYDKVIKIFKIKKVPKDIFLTKENEIGNSAFLLIKGKVSVVKKTIDGEDYVVTIIEAGGDEFFGEINLIDKGRRTSTIKTVEDSIILEITRDKLKNFMDKNPTIGYKIMCYMARSCSKHLRKADEDLITLFNALLEVVKND